MSMSSGTKTLISEAMSWAAVAVIIAVALANFDQVKSVTSGILGLPTAEQMAERQIAEEKASRITSNGLNDTVRLTAGRNGHFFAPVDINGRQIDVMVDTGASMVALTYEDAERAGIFVSPSDFTARSRTANGIARAAIVMIDEIEIGGITVRDVRGSVAEPGRQHITLLGMSFLGRLKSFQMQQGELLLQN